MRTPRNFSQPNRATLGLALAAFSFSLLFDPVCAQVPPQKGGVIESGSNPFAPAPSGDQVPLGTPPSSLQPEASGYVQQVNELLHSGNRLMDQSKFAQARAQFGEALKIDPRCAGAYNGLGASYLRQNNFKQAEAELRKGLVIDIRNVQILNNLGAATYHQGKLPECISYYQMALQLANTEEAKVEPMVNLANALADDKKTAEALQYFEQALKIKPNYAMAYNSLARVYYDRGKFDLAIENAHRAIQFKPDYSMAYYHLGLSELAKQRRKEGIEALQLSYKYEKDPSYAADTKRYLDHLIGGDDLGTPAAPASGTATANTSFDPERITSLLNHKQWKEAETTLRAMIAESGDDPILYNNLGFALAHEKQSASEQFQNAIDAYRKAIDLKQGPFPSAQYNLGQTYRLLGDNLNAEKAFKQAISDAKALRTPMPVAHNALGLLLKQRGDLKAADSSYKFALAQSGNDLPVVHYNRGILLEKMENTREAVREYKAYLARAPKGLNVKQARSRLRRLGVEPPS